MPPPFGKAEQSHILARLERLHTLFDQLDTMTSDLTRMRHVRQLIRRELAAVKRAVKKLKTNDPAL